MPGWGKYERAESSKIIKIFSKCPWPSGFLLWMEMRRPKQKSVTFQGCRMHQGIVSVGNGPRVPQRSGAGVSLGHVGPMVEGLEGSWDVPG